MERLDYGYDSGAFIIFSAQNPYVTSAQNSTNFPVYFVVPNVSLQENKNLEIGQSFFLRGTIDKVSVVTVPEDRVLIGLKESTLQEDQDLPMDFSFSPAELATLEIRLERHACFGDCPIYKATVNGKGEVIWEGEEHVKTKGKQTSFIPLEKVKRLLAFLKAIQFDSLKERYTGVSASEERESVVVVSVAGKSKTIVHYDTDLQAPQKLTILENKIDEVLNTAQ